MDQNLSIPRTSDNVQFNIDLLNDLGIDFTVQHGTYTTTIITSEGKARYMMNQYATRVFKTANLIKKDVMNSENAKEIMESKYLKNNFGVSQNIRSYDAKKVLNIDITSAYATCLLNNKLITEKTYQILKKLPKTERLPCVGMLATSHTKYFYSGGQCINVETFKSKTAAVFFYLIDEINYIMQNIQFILGQSFIFYWVDGVFFNYDTDSSKVKQVEDFLTDLGYDYKYEDVQDFHIDIDDRKIMLKMVKNNKNKQYTIGKDDVGKDVSNYLLEKIKQQKNKPKISQK